MSDRDTRRQELRLTYCLGRSFHARVNLAAFLVSGRLLVVWLQLNVSRVLLCSGTRRARSPSSRATHYEGVLCVARQFKARASFMFAGGCRWRSLAVDGGSGTSRGHTPRWIKLGVRGSPALVQG